MLGLELQTTKMHRNAHTQAAVEWYKKLGQYAIPHLVCLTHGDRLYAECIEEEQMEHNLAYTKKTIKKQVEVLFSTRLKQTQQWV